mgnify:CR=1 FL=1
MPETSPTHIEYRYALGRGVGVMDNIRRRLEDARAAVLRCIASALDAAKYAALIAFGEIAGNHFCRLVPCHTTQKIRLPVAVLVLVTPVDGQREVAYRLFA